MNMNAFLLNDYFHKYEGQAKYMMGSSEPEPLLFKEVYTDHEAMGQYDLSYQLGTGMIALREKIAKLYTTLDPGNIIMFNGAEEAIYIIMRTLLKEGDEIVVHYPCFQSLFAIAKDMRCNIVTLKLQHENNWKLDLADLESKVTKNTKMLVLNSPHNPTGSCLTSAEMTRVIDICKKNNTLLLSDEVYRFLTLSEDVHCDSFVDHYDNTIALSSFSKTFAAPGIRVGWMAAKNDDLTRKVSVYRDFISICLNTVSQLGAMSILDNKESIISRNNQIIRGNEALLYDFMSKHTERFHYVRPVACSTAYVHLVHGSSSAFCLDVLNKTGVLMVPSKAMEERDDCIRVGLGKRSFPKALSLLEEYMQNNAN